MSDPRKAYPTATHIDVVRGFTAKAREDAAAEGFALEAVLLACTKAAQEGFDRVTISPPAPLDLRGTETWKATVAGLRERGFATEETSRMTDGGRVGWSLTVSWTE